MALIADRGIEAVIFDMDGTLLDSTASVERCWDRMADLMGIDRATAPFRHGVPSISTIRECLPGASEDELLEWNRVQGAMEVEDADATVPLPGVFALLRALEAAGVPWAIATSCERDLGEARHAAAGLPHPAAFVCFEDYERGKPAPDAFLHAAAALDIDPRRTVIVEDAPAGVHGAVEAGGFVIAVTHTHGSAELTEAHAIVESLDALRVLLLG